MINTPSERFVARSPEELMQFLSLVEIEIDKYYKKHPLERVFYQVKCRLIFALGISMTRMNSKAVKQAIAKAEIKMLTKQGRLIRA